MSIWAQSYRGSQFHDAHDLEILNNTLRTFASPDPDPDSHTAAKTRHLRQLRDDLPILRIDTNFASPSLMRSSNACQQHKELQSNQMVLAHSKTPKVSDSRKYDSEITRPGVHAVKFNIDPTHHRHKNDKDDDDVNSNFDNERSRIKKQKQLRRASAPYHGMAFSYFSASTTTSIHYFGHQNCSESSQGVGNKPNFSIPSVNIEHHDHSDDINDNSNMAATSPVTSTPGAISSCNVPSLSPCSSASSISSSIDTFNLTVQQQSPPGKVQFSFSSFLPQPVLTPCPIRSKSISTEIPYTSQAHSLPNMVSGASYDNVPWSPAKDFLASLAQATMAKPKPDDEGQQVGEYVIGKEIGRGGFSTVKEAIRMDDYSDLEKVAVKIVKNDQESDCNDRIQSLLQREVTIWKKLDHPNVVPMLSMIEDDYATYIFSEYCPGGTLLQYIKKHDYKGRGLDEDEARNIFLEITEAVRYMHNDMRLVHKDIKLDNILLDKENTWKLCDFGLTEFQNDANGFGELSSCDDVAGGSLVYCPPEQIRSKTPLKEPSVDIWSLGVVLYAMVTGQFPFRDAYEPRLQYKILNGKYDETPLHEAGVSDELRDLLKGMFRTKSADRLNITQLLEHVWCRR